MFTPVSAQTLHFIEGCEGCSLKAYLDSRKIWTIGVGMTRLNGRPVVSTDRITQKQADQLFGATAQYFQNHTLAMIVPEVRVRLTPNQVTALVSLAYNIGLDENHDGIAQGFGDSHLLRLLNAGDIQGCAREFPKWKRAGGDASILLSRRIKEQKLFLS